MGKSNTDTEGTEQQQEGAPQAPRPRLHEDAADGIDRAMRLLEEHDGMVGKAAVAGGLTEKQLRDYLHRHRMQDYVYELRRKAGASTENAKIEAGLA
jgi:hypothetical protein